MSPVLAVQDLQRQLDTFNIMLQFDAHSLHQNHNTKHLTSKHHVTSTQL